MSENNYKVRSTAYDDAFRIIAQECDDVLVCFVNVMFSEHYTVSAKIERLNNEHYEQNDDKIDEKIISDAHFRITDKLRSGIYHLECESKGYGEEILIRMFKYNISHSRKTSGGSPPYKLTIRLPRSGLLILRDRGKPPEKMTFEIVTPGGSVSYNVPVVRMSDYSIDRIFRKKMYLLLPFYFFNLEERLEYYNENEEDLQEFEKIYSEIVEKIEKESEAKLSGRSKRVIIKELENVIRKLADKKDNVIEKVGDIMGRIYKKPQYLVEYDEGVAVGEARGEARGEAKAKAENDKLRAENESLRKEVAELRKLVSV